MPILIEVSTGSSRKCVVAHEREPYVTCLLEGTAMAVLSGIERKSERTIIRVLSLSFPTQGTVLILRSITYPSMQNGNAVSGAIYSFVDIPQGAVRTIAGNHR